MHICHIYTYIHLYITYRVHTHTRAHTLPLHASCLCHTILLDDIYFILFSTKNWKYNEINLSTWLKSCFILLLLLFFLYLEEEGGGEGERNIDQLPLIHAPTGDWTHNPGRCPDQEPNWRPIALQDDAQPTEPHQSEQSVLYFKK